MKFAFGTHPPPLINFMSFDYVLHFAYRSRSPPSLLTATEPRLPHSGPAGRCIRGRCVTVVTPMPIAALYLRQTPAHQVVRT